MFDHPTKLEIFNLESRVQHKQPITTPKPKEISEGNKLINDLIIYGAKEWSKKKIYEWLYPDE